jgi:segregation and condensation protein B
MTGFDHDETTEKPDIAFNVEDNMNTSVGEPVFAEEEVTATEPLAEGAALAAADDSDVDGEDRELNAEDDLADEDLDEELLDASAEGETEDDTENESDAELECAESDDEAVTTTLREELTIFGKIESIVFASPKPMRAVEIHDLLAEQGYTLKEIQDACDELIEFYRDRAGGFHLKYIKRMGYQFQTTPAAKSLMEKQFASRPRPLSRASLETLAVIAYRQKLSKGVTRAEVEFIRGVDAGSIFKTLAERNLLTCIGRKEIPGRPMMFGVTDEFLKIFQLGSINDLPPLESFQTPQDILDAANQKITAFEAEQEGVDTEQFIADEEYSENVRGEAEFNPLAADVPAYAPSIERKPEGELTGQESEITTAEEEKFEAESAVSDEGESQADLIDVLNEGQVAWTASQDDDLERPIQGATAGEVITSVDAIDESEWGDVKPVEMTDNESVQSVTLETSDHQSDEALLNERNATTEVALPTGDSQPPRGGEVDQ